MEEFEDVDVLKKQCNCLQLHAVDKYTSYLITKETLPTETANVHHLFSCDIAVKGRTLLYYHTKNPSGTSISASLELILLVQNVSGSLTKVMCNADADDKKVVDTNTTVVEVCPKKQTESLVMHEGIPEDWQMTLVKICIAILICIRIFFRCFEINFRHGKIIEIGATLIGSDSVYLCGFGLISQELSVDL